MALRFPRPIVLSPRAVDALTRLKSRLGLARVRQNALPERGTPRRSEAGRTNVRLSNGLDASDRIELDRLADRAWRFARLPSTDFSLDLDVRDPEAILAAVYAHARRWATGLDVPYALPRLRFGTLASGTTGTFSASADGWATIEACATLKTMPRALARVLAHEACHHILHHAGLAIRGGESRNERLTELAMFVCGLGQLALEGEAAMTAAGMRCDPALGYMDHRAMVEAEEIVILKIASVDSRSISKASGRELETTARRLFGAPGQVDRMLVGYGRLSPGLSRTELLGKMIEDYQRDRR